MIRTYDEIEDADTEENLNFRFSHDPLTGMYIAWTADYRCEGRTLDDAFANLRLAVELDGLSEDFSLFE